MILLLQVSRGKRPQEMTNYHPAAERRLVRGDRLLVLPPELRRHLAVALLAANQKCH
jgi:hypothetical protein